MYGKEITAKTQQDAIRAPALRRGELNEHGEVFMEAAYRLFTLPALIASKQHIQTRVIVVVCRFSTHTP